MGAHGEKLPFDPPHPDRAALAMVHRQAEDFGWIAERRYERGHEFENIRDVPERRYERLMKMLKPPDVTPDWADFALDSLPQIDSSGALQPSTVHAWSSSTGQRYGTCNPNANPNGVLAGSWTENTQVHGNDQPQ
jgi:hypothetical protein